jgi:hypothetical protein
LQSELFGISKRLEAASRGTPGADSIAALQSLETALNRDYQDISTKELGGVMRIQKLISSWQGIAEINVIGLNILEEGSILCQRTAQILEERDEIFGCTVFLSHSSQYKKGSAEATKKHARMKTYL